MEIGYYDKCLDDIEDLSDNDKTSKELLQKAVEDFKVIDFNKALLSRIVAPLEGVKKEIKAILKNNNYIVNVFEHRDFPKSYPFRIVFIIKNDKTYAILIATVIHGKMNKRFNETINKRLKMLFL